MIRKHIEPLPNHHDAPIKTYLAGYALALALTAAAFVLVSAYRVSDSEIMSRGLLLVCLGLLAGFQLIIQSVFFLHLSAERRARLTLVSTLFTVLVVLTIIVGSLWIMHNLNYNMMPRDVDQYIQQEENIHK